MLLKDKTITFKLLTISVFLLSSLTYSCKNKKKDNPEPIAVDDFPKAFVVNGGSNTISIIDLNTLSVKNIIQLTEVGRFPHHISLSPDKTRLAVAIPEFDFTLGHALLHNATDKKGGVTIVDALNGNTLLKMPLANANFNAAFTNDGTEIWTASATHTGEMFIFDAGTGVLKTKVALGADPSEVVFSKDGTYAFIALGETSFVYVLNTKTKNIEKTIKVDPFPTNVWAVADGKIYVENKIANTINVIDPISLNIVEYLDLDFPPGQMAYHPTLNELWICQANQTKVAYFERKNNLWSLKGTITTGDDAHAITFTKDLKKAFVVNQRGNTVSVIDASTHQKTNDIQVGSYPNGIVLKE
ncbi:MULTISPECIES: YncE family protein [Emticicia]|uniref:YncE family protein n=1 Tax=Emticicia TaxID=312278 RepID=UPI0007D8B304|nr:MULTISPECIES: hypothetical protein [Emticicia]